MEKTLSSDDYGQSDDVDRQQIKASNIDQEGITIELPEEIELPERRGNYGEYRTLNFELKENGESIPAFMNFSSKTLKRMIEENREKLEGKTVNLFAEGSGFDRRYYIDLENPKE